MTAAPPLQGRLSERERINDAVREVNVRFPALKIVKTCCIMNSCKISRRWALQGACVVGRTANIAKALEELSNQFMPQELNEANVQAIFNRCLATKDTPNSDVQLSTLFKKIMGYDKDSDSMAFCKSKIQQNKKNILYLLGQLDSVHRGSRIITAKESIFRYDGTQWATNNAVIGELYHLAEAADGIDPFVQKYNRSATKPTVKPTLSPKDPAFPAWWEAHKADWEA